MPWYDRLIWSCRFVIQIKKLQRRQQQTEQKQSKASGDGEKEVTEDDRDDDDDESSSSDDSDDNEEPEDGHTKTPDVTSEQRSAMPAVKKPKVIPAKNQKARSRKGTST